MSVLTLPSFRQSALPGTPVARRAETLLRDHREHLYCRTDRLFAGLMALQWLAVFLAAYWITPRTWEGLRSQTHPHVWTALLLGGLISFFPILLACVYPGRTLTRHVIAAGQLLMSGLIIHFAGGRVESHFHIFGSLAFLAFYRDWRVLLTASLVTALDHGLRGFLWPQSIYGLGFVEPWRWVEHTGWVVFTDTFLMISIAQSAREMRGIAWQQARQEEAEGDLQQAHDYLERRVQERTAELAQSNAALEIDITQRRRAESERKHAEEQLQRESDFISAVIETVGSLVAVFDRKGRIVRFNRSCEDVTGYSFEELQGRECLDLFLVPDEAEQAKSIFNAIIAGQFPNICETSWMTRGGERRLISWSNTALVDEGGKVEYVIATGTDITERKQLEAEREQALYEALERASHDPLTGLLNHRAFHSHLEDQAARTLCAGTTLAVALLDLDNFRFFNECYGHAVGDEVLRLVAERLVSICAPGDTVVRFGGDEFALLLPNVGGVLAAEVEEKLRVGLAGLTFLPDGQSMTIPISISCGSALFPGTGQDWHNVLCQAGERLLWVKTGGEIESEAQQVRASALRRVQGFSMLDALVTAVDNKDRYTRRHSEDVMAYSLTIARALGMGEAELNTVAVAALLHDVGKIGVPDAILRKPGKLTDEEFSAVKQHPLMGAIMVAAVPGLEGTLDAVRHHHERWDGAGYPFGLVGEQTPRIARLMAVADAFSAMTTDRPYRKGMEKKKALSILREGAETQWDAECVAAFVNSMPH